ncbi:MAG: hypothetical protein ABI697_11065 [Devosia sp.]
MKAKTTRPAPTPIATPTPTAEETRLLNMRVSEAQGALDKKAAETHALKGDVDRAGFDLGGLDGEPIDSGLRDIDAPLDK